MGLKQVAAFSYADYISQGGKRPLTRLSKRQKGIALMARDV